MPERCDVTELVMRELDGDDQIEASIWADKKLSSAMRDSAVAMYAAEQREAIRISLVEVDGQQVNLDGIPFSGMDTWSMRTMRFVLKAFADLNGAEASELESFQKGAQPVLSSAPMLMSQSEARTAASSDG
jgi:hypothetical protein